MKLTPADYRGIRELAKDCNHKLIAREFGISTSWVSRIANGGNE